MITTEPNATGVEELPLILQRQRDAFNQAGPVAWETRIDRLDRCIDLIVEHQDQLCAAVNADFGSRSLHVTRMSDLLTSINSLKFIKKNLKKVDAPGTTPARPSP